jgi:hypothetical protein
MRADSTVLLLVVVAPARGDEDVITEVEGVGGQFAVLLEHVKITG